MKCFLFHRWGRWIQYTVQLPARTLTRNWWLMPATEIRQMRTCKCCGKVRDELIDLRVEG